MAQQQKNNPIIIRKGASHYDMSYYDKDGKFVVVDFAAMSRDERKRSYGVLMQTVRRFFKNRRGKK